MMITKSKVISSRIKKGKMPLDTTSKMSKTAPLSEANRFTKTKEKNIQQYKEQLLREYLRKYIKEYINEIDNDNELNESTFTRRHYIAIANIIKNSLDKNEIAMLMADMFKQDNPAFDRMKFLTACGV